MLHYNTEDMVQQNFPFPAPIMDYIFKNVTASQLIKLYKTCKFFYDKFKLNIIEDFEICGRKNDERIVGNSMAICRHNPAWSKLKNLWISKSFTFFEDINYHKGVSLEHQIFSRLSYTTLNLCGQFSVKDYEFLVKCPSLRHLITHGFIYYPGNALSFEEIIERAPQVSTIHITYYDREVDVPEPIDMTKLLSIERQTKLQSFHIDNVSEVPEPLLVVEFFKKHATPDIDYFIEFDKDDDDFDIENVKRFYKTVDDGLRAWKLSLAIPPIISSFFIDLTGKTVVISGASNGIGKAATILFRQLGASVIAIANSRCQLNNLVNECQNIINSGFLLTASQDVSDTDEIEKLVDRFVFKCVTKIDVLILYADTSEWYCVPNIKCKPYLRNMTRILKSHHYLIKETQKYLIKAKGTIINATTSHDLIIKPKNAASIAKLERNLKIAKLKLASSGVRTNTVNPGAPPTSLTRPYGMNGITYKKYLQDSKKTYDLQCANVIAFLASDAAKLIDGAVLPVNALNLR